MSQLENTEYRDAVLQLVGSHQRRRFMGRHLLFEDVEGLIGLGHALVHDLCIQRPHLVQLISIHRLHKLLFSGDAKYL